jgi:hypothetical protein
VVARRAEPQSKNGYQEEEIALMRSRVFSALLGLGFVGLAFSMASAQAGTILVFGQSGTSDQFTATNNGATGLSGGTTLSAENIAVTVTGMANVVPLPASFPQAYFNLSATSDSNATLDGAGHITQEFNGSFSITSGVNGTGMNYLSGKFFDAVFGSLTGLTMTASGPAGVPTLTSDAIGDLGQSRAISLSFTNVNPPAIITGNMTLGAFTSNVSGSFSAVPEPGSLALLCPGVIGLFALWRRSRRARGA